MKCKNCGHEVREGDLFCENCGSKIEVEMSRSNRNKVQAKKVDPKILAIIIVSILVVLGGGFFVYTNFIADDKPEYQGESTVEEGSDEKDEDDSELKISPKKMEIEVGDNEFIECDAKKVTYRSADSKIATVSSSGRVKGIKPGETTITVKSGDKKATCKVVVKGEDASATLVNDGDYVFPNSSTQLLTEADLQGKSAEQLRIGRNEIYARHGRKFNDESLQNYFNSKSWYQGTVEADAFDESVLSAIEKQNTEFISSHENR